MLMETNCQRCSGTVRCNFCWTDSESVEFQDGIDAGNIWRQSNTSVVDDLLRYDEIVTREMGDTSGILELGQAVSSKTVSGTP